MHCHRPSPVTAETQCCHVRYKLSTSCCFSTWWSVLFFHGHLSYPQQISLRLRQVCCMQSWEPPLRCLLHPCPCGCVCQQVFFCTLVSLLTFFSSCFQPTHCTTLRSIFNEFFFFNCGTAGFIFLSWWPFPVFTRHIQTKYRSSNHHIQYSPDLRCNTVLSGGSIVVWSGAVSVGCLYLHHQSKLLLWPNDYLCGESTRWILNTLLWCPHWDAVEHIG